MTPDPGHLIPFLLAVLLIGLTPGPDMGYLAIAASRFGRLAGFSTVAGITAGLALAAIALWLAWETRR